MAELADPAIAAATMRCPMGMKRNNAASAAQLVIIWLLASSRVAFMVDRPFTAPPPEGAQWRGWVKMK